MAADTAQLHDRIATLEKEKIECLELIKTLHRKIHALEEENDLLAVENERLRAQEPLSVVDGQSNVAPETGIGIFDLPINTTYLEECDGAKYITQELAEVEGVGGGLNPLCVRICTFPSLPASAAPFIPDTVLVAVGGVDKFLTLYRVETNGSPSEKVLVLSGFGGPLLSLDFFAAGEEEGRLLVTCMDGSHSVVHFNKHRPVDACVVHARKDHEKHAVIGRWSRCGRLYATGGHDKAVHLYDSNGGGALKSFYFLGNVEALAFVDRPASGCGKVLKPLETGEAQTRGEGGLIACSRPFLIVASRNVAHLTYIDCDSFEKHTVSLNNALWDTHVSFSVLSLAVSPCQEFLLAATDKSRVILYRIGHNEQLRSLYGHRADEYSNPRVAWDRNGNYVYCSSQEGNELVGWSLASERVVVKLKGHRALVRDMTFDPASCLLASIAYDKTLRLWSS
ncbi:WD40-repeat-containing domain protein [Nannochloropsis gaditana]|uniref:WD40-repeat-containing domain protein n=1 Tax=Nannochloropsis gaditana TaxID=72520 RepID=W7TQQ8_9STRA|nr:WD40-repeat-containing domain protein [Nannochloropsis gaditana]